MIDTVVNFFTIVYGWETILQLVAVSFSVTYVMISFEWSWRGFGKFLFYMLIMFALETVLDFFFFVLSYYVSFFAGINFPLAHLVAIAIFLAFFSKYNIRSRLIMGMTMFIVAVVMAELGQKGKGYFFSDFSFEEWTCIASDIVVVLCAIYVKHFTIENYTDIPTVSVILMAAEIGISVLYIFFTVYITTEYFLILAVEGTIEHALWSMQLFSLCVVFVSSIVCYTVVYRHSKENAERMITELENEQLKADERIMTVSNQAIEEMREIRHDLANQYSAIAILLREKRFDELEEYFMGMNIELDNTVRFIDCGNPVMNSIINSESMKAQAKGVQIIPIVRVSEKMPTESGDLGRLLFNLIDNAVEAVEGSDCGKKSVELSVVEKNDYLFVSVRNPLPAEHEGKSTEEMLENTSKADKGNHGYGHKIVRRIVRKYNGEINYMSDGGEFVAEAMLDLRCAKGSAG